MNKKMILGVALLGAAAVFTFKDKIFGGSNTGTGNANTGISTGNNTNTGSNSNAGVSASPYEGKVVRSPGNDEGWYLVKDGVKIVYRSIEAYKADGSRPIVDISIDELRNIPSNASVYVNEYGKIVNW